MIDAHHHVWQIGQHDCTWPTPDDKPLYRDFGMDDVVPLAKAVGVQGSVLVQSQASDRDTDYLLALAERHDFVLAVVGWADLAAGSAPQRIAQLAQHKKMRGLRPMLQGLADDRWILQPQLAPAVQVMQEHKLSFDALIFPRHLPHIYQFACNWPDLPLVIDHAAKPPIAQDDKKAFATWSEWMVRLAELPWVYCKLSGLLTEANAAQGADALRPYVEQVFHVFGAQRVIWGSDWPVVYAAPNHAYADYRAWFELAHQLIPGQNASVIRQVFSENARAFYRL